MVLVNALTLATDSRVLKCKALNILEYARRIKSDVLCCELVAWVGITR